MPKLAYLLRFFVRLTARARASVYISVGYITVGNRPVSRKRKNIRNVVVINQRDVTAGVHCVEYVACKHMEKSVIGSVPLTAYRISF